VAKLPTLGVVQDTTDNFRFIKLAVTL